MTSLYVRLAAPVQSWATQRVTGNVVHTQPRPTRSGLHGLLAACSGWQRGAWEPWIEDVELTLRTDRAGTVIDEYQTINPRDEDRVFQQRLYPLITGRRWSGAATFTPDAQRLTAVVRRTYLADAVFLVEVRADAHAEALHAALREPRFVPYLGKKAFAPTFPFFLGAGEPGALMTLPTIGTSARGQGRESEPRQLRVLEDLGGADRMRTTAVETMAMEAWLTAIKETLVR